MRDVAGLLLQAAGDLEWKPPAFILLDPYRHMAHAQDGQRRFAAQRQVTLRTQKTLICPFMT